MTYLKFKNAAYKFGSILIPFRAKLIDNTPINVISSKLKMWIYNCYLKNDESVSDGLSS